MLKKLNSAIEWLKALSKKRFFPLLLALAVFAIIYVTYVVFALQGPIPQLTGNETAHELEEKFAAIVSQRNFSFLQGTMLFLILLELGIAIAMIKNRTMSVNRAIILILIAGFIMRTGYGIFTDGLMTRQHDLSVGSNTGNGHYGITMFIYNNWALPERLIKIVEGQPTWDLAGSYQMYHPMLTHITWALFMRFNSFFMGTNIWVLYESVRILSIFFSCMSLYFIYLTFKEFKVQGWPLVMATAIIAFSPVFYRLSAMTNNDPMAYFFIFLGILFTAKWLHKPTVGNIVVIALAIGLGMASKMTAALLAFPVAGVFFYRLFVSIKQKKAFSLIPSFLLFAVIVFPIGLYFPIRSYLLYGQPLTYVWHNLNHHLLVTNDSAWSRFFSFPVDQLTHSLFEILWDDSIYGQDYNIYTSLMKSFLYGEFAFGNFVLAGALMIFNFFLVITMFISMMSFVFNGLFDKKINNQETIFFFGGLGLTFFVSYIQFNLTYPYACTMDFRYVVVILLPIALLVATGYQKTQTQTEHPKLKRFGAKYFPLLVAAFCLTSILYYISAA